MRGFKPIALVGISAIAAAESNSACNSPSSPSTIYVTVPGSPVTETVYAISQGPSPIVGATVSSNALTTTVTSSFTSSQFVGVVQATSSADSFSFTVFNGTTFWLGGKTPPATAVLVTATSFITLQPVVTPGPAVSEGASSQSTTHLTLYSTETITETSTMTLIDSSSAILSSVGAYTGLKSSGWNATMTTLLTIKAATTGTGSIRLSPYQPAFKAEKDAAVMVSGAVKLSPYLPALKAEEKAASFSGTAYALTTSLANPIRLIKARQAADIVVATIDGVIVSWTNDWNGPSPSTPLAEASPAPVTAAAPPVAPAPLLVSATAVSVPTTSIALAIIQTSEVVSALPSSSVPSTSNSGPGPTTTVGDYPWDFSPASSAFATSLTLSLASHSVLQSDSPTVQSTASFTSTAVPSTSAQAISSMTWSNTSTATGSAATNTASSCGDCCENTPLFTIDFDDLPHFSIGDNPAESDIPPIFNPYRKLFFQDHFGYVPPPSDPFPPRSPPQLAIYREAGLDVTGSPDAGLLLLGEIGSGPRAADSAYWIDAYSVWFGCSNDGPQDCEIKINGYTNGGTSPTITQAFTQPPCPGLKNCSLALLEFNDDFRSLIGLQIITTVGTEAVDYYMDDLELSWSNNTCAAQQERSSSE